MSGINVNIDIEVDGRRITSMRYVSNTPPTGGSDDGARPLGELLQEVGRLVGREQKPRPSLVTITIYAGKTHELTYLRQSKIASLLEDAIPLRDFVKLVIQETSDA